MAKRDNNYSRTIERTDFREYEDIESCLDYIEKNGKLKYNMVLPPKYISPRCNKYYDILVIINNIIKSYNPAREYNIFDSLKDSEYILHFKELINNNNEISNEDFIVILKKEKINLQTKFINLSSIVIGSCVKRFPSLYPLYYNDMFTACVIDILDKINKNNFDKTKSSIHSYIYETNFWAIIKYLNEKAQYENNTVQLLQV